MVDPTTSLGGPAQDQILGSRVALQRGQSWGLLRLTGPGSQDSLWMYPERISGLSSLSWDEM